jgi:hypothetical protein
MSTTYPVIVRLAVPEATIVARSSLPPSTGVTDSPPEWSYITDSPIPAQQFVDLDGKLLLELCPPPQSEEQAARTVIESARLLLAVRTLAAATLVAKHWPQEARRDKAASALAGALLREGKTLPAVKQFVAAVVEAAKDPRAGLRASAVEDAAKRLNNKRSQTGWPTLEKIFGPDLTAQLKYWLEDDCPTKASAVVSGGGGPSAISLPEFESRCNAAPESYVVEGLIPEASINIAAGDSGLGKSPWAYQMGLCVASGVQFLGHEVKQGRVLYVDLENGQSGIIGLARSLARHLGLPQCPEAFYLINEHDHAEKLEPMVAEVRPSLVIVDSLRAFRPEAEKNENAAKLINELRQIARQYKTAFFIIHHIKKPNDDYPSGALEDTPAMTWLLQACGGRALINQTDVRIGFDATLGTRGTTMKKDRAKNAKDKSDEIGLVVKGFARLHGEFGPLFLRREFDEDGSPLGYRALAGLELLFNSDQEAIVRKLPNSFTFKQAKLIYGRRDQATADLLQKLQRICVLTHVRGGLYTKTPEYAESE